MARISRATLCVHTMYTYYYCNIYTHTRPHGSRCVCCSVINIYMYPGRCSFIGVILRADETARRVVPPISGYPKYMNDRSDSGRAMRLAFAQYSGHTPRECRRPNGKIQVHMIIRIHVISSSALHIRDAAVLRLCDSTIS